MKPYSLLAACLCLLASFSLHAQEKPPVKFGKITAADFEIKQPFDSGAAAVVIADIGNSSFEGSNKGWFSLIYKRTTRIKILNKQGFDASQVKISLSTTDDGSGEEKLDDLKAFTYNLENGQVVATKLESANIFKDKLSKNLVQRKFTMPAVKEGSIIEYTYTVRSDFIRNLRSWYFQSEYPCLYSSYEVDIPEFFRYVTIGQGYFEPELKTESYTSRFRVVIPGGADRNDAANFESRVQARTWIVHNVPALKPEKYTSSIMNYVAGLQFQLSSHQFEWQTMPHDYMGNWSLLGKQLMENDYFGAPLSKNNGWLDDDLKVATAGAATKLEKAQKIFAFLRDHITCTDHAELWIDTNLKDAWKKHSGSVADINLMLVAMLHHENIEADPVTLSTRGNGFTSELYPLLQRFNYVICRAQIDGKTYDLDASSPYNGFGRLGPQCYNGHARIITKDAAIPVYFEADSLKEAKITSVFIANDEKEGLTGTLKTDLGYNESLLLREELKGDASGYFKKLKTSFPFEITVVDPGIDSLKQPDMPASVHYDFAFKPNSDENIWYFNPMLTEGYKENPFKSAERKYPVEMPFTLDETYIFNMDVPKGWAVEEVPKSVRFAFNTDEGYFEYLVQKSDDAIMLRSRVRLNKANFTPDDYQGLREFFSFIVKKQAESIVLKKKS